MIALPAGLGTGRPVAGDPYWSDVSSLLHFDGPNASTTFTDQKGLIWTPNGAAQISTAKSVFGGASGLFDGTTSYLTASGSSLTFGTGPFCLEARIRCTSFATNRTIFNFNNNCAFYFGSSGRLYYYDPVLAANVISDPAVRLLNTWYGVRLDRDAGGTLRMFVDGSLVASPVSYTRNLTSSNMSIGRQDNAAIGFFAGNIDEVRITRRSRGAANYTLDAAPFPNS